MCGVHFLRLAPLDASRGADFSPAHGRDLDFLWSGRRDSNPRPSQVSWHNFATSHFIHLAMSYWAFDLPLLPTMYRCWPRLVRLSWCMHHGFSHHMHHTSPRSIAKDVALDIVVRSQLAGRTTPAESIFRQARVREDAGGGAAVKVGVDRSSHRSFWEIESSDANCPKSLLTTREPLDSKEASLGAAPPVSGGCADRTLCRFTEPVLFCAHVIRQPSRAPNLVVDRPPEG
jgi:hypothetical protein